MPISTAQTFRMLWHLMRGERLRYGAAIGCLMLANGFAYLVPLVGTATIDHAIGDQQAQAASPVVGLLLGLIGGPENLREYLWLAVVAMLMLAAAGGLFSFFKGRQSARAADGIARALKNRLYDHLNHLPARHHDRTGTGDLVQRCTSDVETMRQFLSVQVVEICNAAVLAGLAVPLMLLLDARMTAISFALVPPLVLFGYFYFLRVKHVFREVDEAEGALTGVIQENLTGIRVVRAFGRQDHEEQRFAGPNAAYRDKSLRMIRMMSWYWSVSDLAALSQIGLVLFFGVSRVAQGTLSIGELFAFMAYLQLMLWPVRQMGRVLTDLGKTSVALGRIREILEVAPESEPDTASCSLPSALTGAIRVRDLHFSHDGERHALNGLSFSVEPGQTLAILGPSGSGKSTLIHLLLRLYDYNRGEICLDGRELRTLPRKWVRRQVGVVMQEPFLFSKSLRENIRLGHGEAHDAEISSAARIACIHETIEGFSQGYDTLIGERGITLSGGQRQRVAIARALLRQPPILILDDALSAIDAETEHLLLEALRTRRGRRTTLIIAHRLSTLAHADRTLVLDQGRVVQEGTHQELSATDGLYRRVWEIQTRLGDEEAVMAPISTATTKPASPLQEVGDEH